MAYSAHLLEVLEIVHGPVAVSNGFHFTRVKNAFHLSPRSTHTPAMNHSPSPVGVDRKKLGRLILLSQLAIRLFLNCDGWAVKEGLPTQDAQASAQATEGSTRYIKGQREVKH